MATVNPTITFIGNDTVKFVWALDNTDADGAPIGTNHADYADRNVHVSGTFGGGAVHIQGSNTGGSTWHSLDDPQGNNIEISAAGGKGISEVTELTRPLLVGGSGSALTVAVLARRSRG